MTDNPSAPSQDPPVNNQRTFPFNRLARRVRGRAEPAGTRPHVIYLAIGFPPAAKSCAYRMRETANQFCQLGWDVTVVTICQEAWEREYGLDHTLSEAVDPRVRIVELPLFRDDLETDLRAFTEKRTLRPQKWKIEQEKREQRIFPEGKFGRWRFALEKALLRVHQDKPADLLLTTCAPYVTLAATWRLWEAHRVPYAVDFRDGWSINVITGAEAFSRDSVAGRWEQRVLAQARAVWCVNDAIAQFYRERYADLADRIHVVRNGFDHDSRPTIRTADPAAGLTFGYLGSVNFRPELLDSVLTAWRIARQNDELVGRSRFEVRGHFGAGWMREANAHVELLKAAAPDNVVFAGPVPKAEVTATYERWDALVLMLVGGRYVTSGKVYEFMASGLPVLSAHEVDHDASNVLADYPLWTGACGLDPHRLAAAFSHAARLAVEATDEDRQKARANADRYRRDFLLAPAVEHIAQLALSGRAVNQHPAPQGVLTGDPQP